QEGNARAVELAEKAHSLAPDNPQIADTLGWILAREGETGRAVELLRDAASKMPGNAEIAYHLASVLADAGEAAEAKRILERLLASTTEFSSRAAAEQLAARL
ncbi:MAG: tetratricopeptide repeat protein, partial [Woeseia sp.]